MQGKSRLVAWGGRDRVGSVECEWRLEFVHAPPRARWTLELKAARRVAERGPCRVRESRKVTPRNLGEPENNESISLYRTDV